MLFNQELPEGDWFCCSDCGEIHNALRNLVAHGEDHLPNSLFSFIKTKDEKKGSEPESAFDIRWRVLNNKLIAYDDHEAERLLSRVVAIFQDRFDPIIDPSSGKDFISAMLEGYAEFTSFCTIEASFFFILLNMWLHLFHIGKASTIKILEECTVQCSLSSKAEDEACFA